MTRGALTRRALCFALVGALWAGAARAGEPAAEAVVRAALDGWRLDDAAAGLAKVKDKDARAVLEGRLALMRSEHARAAALLAPIVKATPGQEGYEARVLYGRALIAAGDKAEGHRVLDQMADDYNDDRVTTAEGLMWLGVGLMLTDYPKNAHRVFREALDKDPKLTLAKRLWADLHASKYDYRKADPLYKACGADVMATVGRAKVAIESDRAFAEAVELMTPLLAASPQCVPCHNVLALVDLHNERPEAAVKRLEEEALKVAPRDGEALALLGAAYYLLDDAERFAAVEARALEANPKAARFYATAAEHAEREHRYPEAITLLEKALALDPDDWDALGMLGTGYSRIGEDDKARATLERAFDGDPFNVRVYNLLAHFYDKADKRYSWFEAAPMRVRADRDEAALLEKVVPSLLQEAERALTKKYGVAPKPPLHIEIFKNPETFAVRSTGLPGLAAHGICFGHVITARSPSAGDFNWAEVLWHELAHVYHIQMTDGRVPRWFTEGLAVLESLEARPAWEREQDRELRAALIAGKLRGVADFNLAFTQAKTLQEILVAYYQAYQVTRFIRDTWGFAAMREMLVLWGKRKGIDEVFAGALGVAPGTFDARFFVWLEAELAYLEAAYPIDLERYRALAPEAAVAIEAAAGAGVKEKGEAAILALARGQREAAARLAEEALAAGEAETARYVRAILGMRDKATRAQAKADWEALRAAGKAGVEGLAALAALATDAAEHAQAAKLWGEAAALDPKNPWPLAEWAAALEAAGERAEAHAVRMKLLGVEQADPSLAVKVLEGFGPKARAEEVREVAEQALHIAPFSIDVLLARARALAAAGLQKEAREAARLALIVEPDNAEARAITGE